MSRDMAQNTVAKMNVISCLIDSAKFGMTPKKLASFKKFVNISG